VPRSGVAGKKKDRERGKVAHVGTSIFVMEWKEVCGPEAGAEKRRKKGGNREMARGNKVWGPSEQRTSGKPEEQR
jgi:hypothetical protein